MQPAPGKAGLSGRSRAALAWFLGMLTLGTWLLSACGGGNDSASAPVSTPLASPPPHLTATSAAPPSGVVQEPYNEHPEYCRRGDPNCVCIPDTLRGWECNRRVTGFQLAATGGTEPYRWIPATGSVLPPGLELQVSGLIDGTPTTAGHYDVTVSVSDSSTPPLEASVRFAVTVALPPPPEIVPASLPSIVVNQPYRFALTAMQGPLPVTWSESGVLPPGIALSADGVISGTATASGSYPITIVVQDSEHQSGAPQSVTLDVTSHGFVVAGNMVGGPRSSHTATLLNDGRVLLIGMQDRVELYDPVSGRFAVSIPETIRTDHTANRLANGQVLIAGGQDVNGFTASAELYHPATKTFTAVGTMGSARDSHTATLLHDGRVLVAGGFGASGSQATAEVFDPATGSFSATGSMSTPRALHRATLLGDGTVLITGGVDAANTPLASAELYDPTTGTFTQTGTMSDQRSTHTATMLRDGRVLVTGGSSAAASAVASAEIYDPANGSFQPTKSMRAAHAAHTATLLNDGTVLVAGGIDESGTGLLAAELYDPGTGQFVHTGSLQSARQLHTATLLGTGKVLVTGGNNPAVTWILSSTELYE